MSASRSAASGAALFRFVQCEWPWPLGPADGRYLLRPEGEPGAEPHHVLVLGTLGAPERRRLGARRRATAVPEPPPTPVTTSRATIIDVRDPFGDPPAAAAWLRAAGEPELVAGLEVLQRALHVFRIAAGDPHLHPPGRRQAIVARLGYGDGEQVADGRWRDARELAPAAPPRRRAAVLGSQVRLAALFSGRQRPLVCEELVLRARLDLDAGRQREAALQLLVALDAAVAELAIDPAAPALSERLDELRALRAGVGQAAQTALVQPLDGAGAETITGALARLEAALRARAAADAG